MQPVDLTAVARAEAPAGGALEEAQQLFSQAELPFPYVPDEMRGKVARIQEWMYGTRADTPNLYDLGWFVHEAATQPVQDYLLFGHAGHGVNSWAMHYYLARGQLALFIQSAWGGAYEDEAAARRKLVDRWAHIERLIRAVEEARRGGRLSPAERLIVVVSDFSGFTWRRLEGAVDEAEFARADAWQHGEYPAP
jgi:hypothetical protein